MTRVRGGFILLLAVASAIIAAAMGIRQSFGVFLQPIILDLALTRDVFGLAVAIQNLAWGLAQPAAGILADKYGSFRVLAVGGLLYALGLVMTAYSSTAAGLYLNLGVLVGLGLSGATFTVVLSAVGRLAPPEKRSLAFGVVSAAGSVGMFSFVPAAQLFIGFYGWSSAVLILAGCALLTPMLALLMRRQAARAAPPPSLGPPSEPLAQALKTAAAHSGYWLLNLGFLVCGFHVAFIATHLPAFLNDQAATPMAGAVTLGLIGFFNIIGTYAAGLLGGRYRKKHLLSALYLARALVIALFLAAPMSTPTLLLFGAAMGLLWLGTVPLTSALVVDVFGVRHSGALFGVVFLSHQVGSFLGAWLGGYFYEAAGSYDPVWHLSILLGVVAALLHWPIRDAPLAPRPAPAAGGG